MSNVSPTATQVYDPPFLTDFAVTYERNQRTYASPIAFTNRTVSKQSGKFRTYNKADFLAGEGPKPINEYDEARQVNFRMGQDTFDTQEYAYFHPITDEARANEDEGVRLEERTVNFLTGNALREQEVLMGNVLLADNVWGNGTGSATSGASLDLTDNTTKVINTINRAKEGVFERIGFEPRDIVVTKKVFNRLREHDDIRDLVSGGATVDAPALVTPELIARALDVDNIYVSSVSNGSSIVGGDKMLLYYKTADNEEGPTAAMRFSWNGIVGDNEFGYRVFMEREPFKRADRVTLHTNYAFKVVTFEAGYLFNPTVS